MKKNPELKFFGMLLFAGHGMIFEGRQTLLLNQFDKKREFYWLDPIEQNFRNASSICKNSYLVGIVACCREIFIKERHCDCVKAVDAEEATKIFEEKMAAEELKKSQTLTQEQEIQELKKQVKEMQDIIANKNSEEEAIVQEEDEETKQEV